ncbi:hypothetical protein [Diaminobutyricimonas sp. LJ205]|uniref:hypothetical protein n=1 Tax=Diaminobutyricimonas sp. LJ205 TaxID=2683590 RepID=UPI0012F4B7F7|nr:hypothetical protein [Diaminobutyricimonas sp. LJ205]
MTDVTDAPDKTSAPNRARMLVLKSIVASVVGAALVAVVSVLVGEFGSLSWRLLGTVVLFILFSLMSWYDAEVSAKRATWFGFASAGISVYLFAAGMFKLWFPIASTGLLADFLAWGWLVLVARIALLHVHLLIVQQSKFVSPVMSSVNKVTFGLVVILAAMLSVPALLPDLELGEFFWRILFAVAILDVLGTVLIPLVYVLFHRPARPAPQPYNPAHAPGYLQQAYPQPGSPAPVAPQAPVPAAAPAYGVPAPQPTYGVPATQPTYGVPAPQPAYGVPAPQPAYGVPAPQPAYGVPAPQPTYGVPAPQPVAPQPVAAGGFVAPDAAAPVPPIEAPVAPAAQPMQLEWPRYTNGQPVPALPNGLPDLSAPAGGLAWPRYVNGQPVPALPDGSPDLSATLQ